MGGEQWPILVYGSTEKYDLKEWIIKLKLSDKNDVKEDLGNVEDDFDNLDDEEDFDDLDDNDQEKLTEFLEENGLTNVFFNNYDWDEFSIGFEVKDFQSIKQDEIDKIKAFCEKYNLTTPTLFAGIVGEFE